MRRKTYFYSFLLIAIFAVTVVGFYFFFRSPYYQIVDYWVKRNTVLFVLSLFLYKTVGVLFPPIPGGIVTMASIPFLGWFGAYIVDLVGSLCGGTIAYFLAKKYGHPLLHKILGEDVARKVEKIKIKKGREIEAVFMYRIALGSTILEAVYYGAGFLRVGFKNFLVGSFFSHIVVGVPTFYLTSNIINGSNIVLTVVLSIIGIAFIFYTKGRYFE